MTGQKQSDRSNRPHPHQDQQKDHRQEDPPPSMGHQTGPGGGGGAGLGGGIRSLDADGMEHTEDQVKRAKEGNAQNLETPDRARETARETKKD